ncbi:hypothetical protein [Hyphomicrobium sp.]|uniref:hypothetical protein n=1 Tax=Hyphomicrobium sp. TaxID=82 RepID=UPI003F6F1669
MPIGAQKPGVLARLIEWVRAAFQGAQAFVAAPASAGDLPSLFIPRIAAARAALVVPVALAPVMDFAATLRTFALAARLRSVAMQNVRCSLKGRRRRRTATAGKPIPKPTPRVLKRYSPARAPIAPQRRCGTGWTARSADVLALPEIAARTASHEGSERQAA